MDSFGVTFHGPQDPIKFFIKEGFSEPQILQTGDKSLLPKDPNQPVRDYPRLIDCFHGRVDGLAYRSVDRLLRQREMNVRKKTGNEDTYRLPITTSMNYGWPLPEEFTKGMTWWETPVRYPLPKSEMSEFYAQSQLQNPIYFWY